MCPFQQPTYSGTETTAQISWDLLVNFTNRSNISCVLDITAWSRKMNKQIWSLPNINQSVTGLEPGVYTNSQKDEPIMKLDSF